ncbi:MAG: 3-deoxy-D-manno-octulosonic acid transferase [Chitinophagaceae bacterium]|nr:MAG: 3-deoxy-D-manno-octulosonic acid transferase [Chitinophagaceae bacterium]
MALFAYQLFLLLYKLGARFLAPWNPKAASWLRGRRGLMQNIENAMHNRPAGKLVWVHCASLGEFEQGRPVIEAIRKEHAHVQILVTFYSPSGYEIRKNYPGANWVFYLPMDSPSHAANFVKLVKPNLVIWVKYEYWYYYLKTLSDRNIPVLLVSGIFRRNQVFFKWYGSLHRKMLQFFRHLFVQDEASAGLLAAIPGTPGVTVSGDTRFDRVAAIAGAFTPIDPITAFCGGRQVIVAGSTWQEDEEELDHFANTHPDVAFIIAPHEIDEPHLKTSEQLFKRTVRYSRWQTLTPESQQQHTANVLIIDNIGMLSRLYHYATITYVGGGFGDDGIHNILEAAVYGKPVVFGPAFEKFREAIDLLEAGGAFTVSNALELEEIFNTLLKDHTVYNDACQAAYNYTKDNQGATNTILSYIREKKFI